MRFAILLCSLLAFACTPAVAGPPTLKMEFKSAACGAFENTFDAKGFVGDVVLKIDATCDLVHQKGATCNLTFHNSKIFNKLEVKGSFEQKQHPPNNHWLTLVEGEVTDNPKLHFRLMCDESTCEMVEFWNVENLKGLACLASVDNKPVKIQGTTDI